MATSVMDRTARIEMLTLALAGAAARGLRESALRRRRRRRRVLAAVGVATAVLVSVAAAARRDRGD